jgi:hypothetical protein
MPPNVSCDFIEGATASCQRFNDIRLKHFTWSRHNNAIVMAFLSPLVLSANQRDAERSPWCRLHGLDHQHHRLWLVGLLQTLALVRLPGHHRLFRPRAPELLSRPLCHEALIV